MRTVLFTAAAMLAFAANSLLCRMALGGGLIDAASFATVRVCSGALILAALLWHRTGSGQGGGSWKMAAMLGVYMVCFSFAYLSLDAGTGALLLFGAVQLTMFVAALRGGERFPPAGWAGLALAAGGLIYLVSPGLTAPDPLGAVLMVAAGVGWGFYSLLGRGSVRPMAATTRNFVLCVPGVLLVSALSAGHFHATARGLVLAVLSGALASALGYVCWYAALGGLSASRAATVQLSVPAIAAAGGVLLLAEPLTLRLVLASLATLGGIAIALTRRAARAPVTSPNPATRR